jgi:hypothetical protein
MARFLPATPQLERALRSDPTSRHLSNGLLARRFGVHRSVAQRIRARLECSGAIPAAAKRLGLDAKTRDLSAVIKCDPRRVGWKPEAAI